MKRGKQYVNLDTAKKMLIDDNTLQKVLNYLEYVTIGNQGDPYCPFVTKVHFNNGYYIKFFPEHPSKIDFNIIVQEMQESFFEISPNKTHINQKIDITTIVAAFSHTEAITHKFGQELEKARNQLRSKTLYKGLMLSQMYPFHLDPTGGQRYVSAIPMLMIRRMHYQDFVFMNTEEERKIFNSFFGELNSYKKLD